MDYDLAVPQHISGLDHSSLDVLQGVGPFGTSSSSSSQPPPNQRQNSRDHSPDGLPSQDGTLHLVSSRNEPLHIYVYDSIQNVENIRQKIMDHGGIIAKQASRAQYLLVDQEDPEFSNLYRDIENQPIRGKLVDVRWLDASINAKTRLPVSDYKPRKPRKNKPKSDRKYNRTVPGRTDFTPEEDLILAQWLRDHPKGRRGNTAYMEIAAKHPSHTWQSWRNRYVKDEQRILGIIERLERESQENSVNGNDTSNFALTQEEIRPKRKLTKRPIRGLGSTSQRPYDEDVTGFPTEIPDIHSLADLSGAALALVQSHGWTPDPEGDITDSTNIGQGPSISNTGDLIVGDASNPSASTTAAIEAALASATAADSSIGVHLDSPASNTTPSIHDNSTSANNNNDSNNNTNDNNNNNNSNPEDDQQQEPASKRLRTDTSNLHDLPPLLSKEEEDRQKQDTLNTLISEYGLTQEQGQDIWYSCSGSKETSEAFAKILLAGDAETEEEMLNLQNDEVWAQIWSPDDDDIALEGSEEDKNELDREKGIGSVARRKHWLSAHDPTVGAKRYPFETV